MIQWLKSGVIRFPMVFDCWCKGCDKVIEFGTRYNAKKETKAEKYLDKYPVYQFTMKCAACDQIFVVESDPANASYKAVSGLRVLRTTLHKREEQREEKGARASPIDALAKLENQKVERDSLAVLATLRQRSDGQSKNDYLMNSLLRSKNRVKRKEEEELLKEGQAMGLPYALLPDTISSESTSSLSGVRKSALEVVLPKRRRMERLARDPFLSSQGGTPHSSSTGFDAGVNVVIIKKKRKKKKEKK
jgi:hypothetical protein